MTVNSGDWHEIVETATLLRGNATWSEWWLIGHRIQKSTKKSPTKYDTLLALLSTPLSVMITNSVTRGRCSKTWPAWNYVQIWKIQYMNAFYLHFDTKINLKDLTPIWRMQWRHSECKQTLSVSNTCHSLSLFAYSEPVSVTSNVAG